MNPRSTLGLVVFAGICILILCPHTATSQQPKTDRLNRTIELLQQEKATFGIFSKDRSLDNARELARSSLDFIIIDMEHGPFDTETLRNFLLGMVDKRAILEKGGLQPNVTPIVRIPSNGGEQLQFLAKQ